ncbi:MAG: hypothetical protein AAGF74_15110 [Pseudomonadota bacterium]
MDRTELIIATTVILFGAFVVGWFANWLLHRFTRVTQAELGELDKLAQQLHDAEEARDKAILAMEEHENTYKKKLIQSEAELEATMDGLRAARRTAEDLRNELDKAKAG